MWIGRSLSGSFFVLQSRFRWSEFTVEDAAEALRVPRARATLALSRLARAGWVERPARGRYVALDARWARERSATDPLARFRDERFFPSLVGAVAGVLQWYGPRLRALALFGSCARGDHRPDSDLDLLLVADPLPATLGGRIDELRGLRTARGASPPPSGGREAVLPQFVPLTLEELASEPPLLLDMTQDAVLLFDPEAVLAGALARLRNKLHRHGARRVVPMDGPAYWMLHPGAGLGEVGEL